MGFRLGRIEADVASEAPYIAGEVTAATVGQPLDVDRQAIDRAEAILAEQPLQLAHLALQCPVIRRRHDLFAAAGGAVSAP